MKRPRLTLVGAAAAAVVRTPQEPLLPDREPAIRQAIEQLREECRDMAPVVAVVVESTEGNRAIVEWLYNPIPDGQPLIWPNQPDATEYDLLRAVWQFGYEQRDADGRQFMGQVGAMLAQLKPVIDACAAQVAASPATLTPDVPDAWRPDFDALRRFLEARDRKCDDGDSLQGYADAEAALTAQLGLPSGLDRMEAALVDRRLRQRAAGDVQGMAATKSALELLRDLK